MQAAHRPVMLAEVLRALAPQDGGLFVDGTLGAGGHAAAILEASSPGGLLLGLDRDDDALALARTRLKDHMGRVKLARSTFDQALFELKAWQKRGADGVLLDLGVSSMQLDRGYRGFSFRKDAPLDMRMGHDGPTAAELVARAEEDELARIFYRLGEEPMARRIARRLVQAREQKPIDTTGRLAALVDEAVPAARKRGKKIHPATRVFMALRIKVNDELGQLERFLDRLPDLLAPGGRVAVISYHSLEDRMVKKALARLANPCTCPPDLPVCACGKKPIVKYLGKRAVKPTQSEVDENPRARSAVLRSAVRTSEAL